MTSIIIKNVNHSYVQVNCDTGVAWELRDAFSFRPQGFQFVPAYKNKLWDGYIRMYNPNTRLIYRGLVDKVIKWSEEKGYEVEYPDQVSDSL